MRRIYNFKFGGADDTTNNISMNNKTQNETQNDTPNIPSLSETNNNTGSTLEMSKPIDTQQEKPNFSDVLNNNISNIQRKAENRMNEIQGKIDIIKNDYVQNYTNTFVSSLIKIKISLIILFILITVVYLIQQETLIKDGNIHVYTMLHSKNDIKQLLKASCIDAFFVSLSFIFILATRGGIRHLFHNIVEHMKEIVILAIVFFLFRFAQESSGMNRWLAPKSDTYTKLDKEQLKQMVLTQANILREEKELENANSEDHYVLSEQELLDKASDAIIQKYKEQTEQCTQSYTYANPFRLAIEKTSMGLLTLFILFQMGKMFIAFLTGFNSGNHKIGVDGEQTLALFVFECVGMAVINMIPSLVAPKIYGEKVEKKDILMALGMGGLSFGAHIWFQYAGLYSSLSNH